MSPPAGRATPISGELVRPLSDEDLTILALENETVAGHTCKVIVLGGRVDAGLLRASIASRLHRAPALRLVLREIDGELWWASVPQLDIEAHIAARDDLGVVDRAALRAAVADAFTRRLDRSSPLWRIEVIPTLADGGSALIWSFHHAVADGSTMIDVAREALWDEGAGAGAPVAGSNPSTTKTRLRAPVVHHHLEGARAAARVTPHPWHRSPFAGRIDAQRTVAFTSLGLDALRRVAHATDGATINDAVLTLVGGGLRRWLESHGGQLGAVRVKVPVSLHGLAETRDGAAEPGNRDSFFCLDVPLSPADPVARLRAVSHATRLRKAGRDAEQIDAFMHRLARVPQLRALADRLLANPHSFALNVSNVRGPRQLVRVLAAPVRELYSLAEIRQNHALRIAVVSLGDTLNFGLTADPTLVPEVDRLADHIAEDATDLVDRLSRV